MRPTRRGIAAGALVPVLAVLAIVFASPVPLVGAVLVGAWFVGRQVAFTDVVVGLTDGLTVRQAVDADRIHPGATAPIRLEVSADRDPRATVTVEGGPPVAADPVAPVRLTLGPSQRTAETVVDTAWPLAGNHAFERATVTVDDGIVAETVPHGETATVLVEPPRLRDIHVGVGGNRARTSYGEHKANRFGSGIEPASIRAAQVGDPASHIDWKATARLGEPYVREFEVETDRETVLVLDTRASLGEGPPGAEKLALLRSVLLTLVEGAAGFGDPVAAATIDAEGIDHRLTPGTADVTYRGIRRLLDDATPATDTPNARRHGRRRAVRPAEAERQLAALGGDDTAFAAQLRPFLEGQGATRAPFDENPLFAGLQELSRPAGGRRWFVIATDDERPAELRESVASLRQDGHAVTCYLAPSVLYRPRGGLDQAYDDYARFEEYRRDLAAVPGVQAFEVGPRDRLGELLDRGQGRHREVLA